VGAEGRYEVSAASVTLSGNAASACLLTIPGTGLWYAGVDMLEPVELAGPVTLQFLDTTWQGCVIAGGPVDGRARYRVVAGTGGWGSTLAPRAYANDAGLTIAKLVKDAASEAGEPAPTGAPSTTVGPHFDRREAPASFVLNQLAPRGWYAGADGVVTFGARAALAASSLPIVDRNPASRSITLGLSASAAGLLPGTDTEYGAAADVELEAGPEGLRARLYAAPAGVSRRALAYARIQAAVDPGARFRGVHEYRVVTQSGERLNLQPVRSRSALPDLARVPVRAGVPGVKATHAPGSKVLVAFLDGDPGRPSVVGFDDPEQPGWMPLFLELGAAPTLGVARQTDPVIAGPFAGTITLGSTRIKAGL
jgi:hypothetical protein